MRHDPLITGTEAVDAGLVVGGLGVVYMLVGVLGIFVPDLFGLLPSEYETVLDNSST